MPAVATTQIGVSPAPRSAASAASSAPASSRRCPSAGTVRSCTPRTPHAFAIEKCACSDAWTVSLRRSGSGPARDCNAISSAVRLAAEPPLTSTPAGSAANPTKPPSQRSTTCSSSVAAGAERHAVTF